MKKIIVLTLILTALTSFGETKVELSFDSVESCKKQSKKLIDNFNSMSLAQFYTSFGMQSEFDDLTAVKILINQLNGVKSEAGEFKYTEEIGSSALGTFYTKVGYIIKYESGTFFCEVKIGKISETEYKIIGMGLSGQKNGQKLIEGIPEYYWK